MPALWRSLIGALGWRRKTADVVAGTKPVDILRLISPLRYDVVVRREFFELLAGEERLAREDFDRFVALAGASPYREWFERVYCVRFHPDLIEDPRSKLRGIFDRKEWSRFLIRSLTPPQAAGNALAFAVQRDLVIQGHGNPMMETL